MGVRGHSGGAASPGSRGCSAWSCLSPVCENSRSWGLALTLTNSAEDVTDGCETSWCSASPLQSEKIVRGSRLLPAAASTPFPVSLIQPTHPQSLTAPGHSTLLPHHMLQVLGAAPNTLAHPPAFSAGPPVPTRCRHRPAALATRVRDKGRQQAQGISVLPTLFHTRGSDTGMDRPFSALRVLQGHTALPGTGRPRAVSPFMYLSLFHREAPCVPQHPDLLWLRASAVRSAHTSSHMRSGLLPLAQMGRAARASTASHCTASSVCPFVPSASARAVHESVPTAASKHLRPHSLPAGLLQGLPQPCCPQTCALPRCALDIHRSMAPHLHSRCSAHTHCPRRCDGSTHARSSTVHPCGPPDTLQQPGRRAVLLHTHGHGLTPHCARCLPAAWW